MHAMPNKTPIKKGNKKIARKKLRLSRLIFIILASIIALAFLFFSTYTPKRIKPTASQSFSYSKSAPSFRKDGSLSIILTKNPSPITLDIEIADDDEERMRGLMDRQNLPDNAGMLFIFPNDEP